MALSSEENLDAAMHEAFAVHSAAYARFVHDVDASLLENAGTDATEHVLAGHALKDDCIDTGLVQQLTEQQPRRTRADDGDLRTRSSQVACPFISTCIRLLLCRRLSKPDSSLFRWLRGRPYANRWRSEVGDTLEEVTKLIRRTDAGQRIVVGLECGFY